MDAVRCWVLAALFFDCFLLGLLGSTSTSDDHSSSWNFTQWWDERAENTQLYSEPVVFDEPAKSLQQYGDFDKFGHVQYKPFNPAYPEGVLVTSSMLEVDQNFSPMTSVDALNSTIRQYFSMSRHWSDDRHYLRDLREALKEKFLGYGLKTAFHVFKTEYNPNKMVSRWPIFGGGRTNAFR